MNALALASGVVVLFLVSACHSVSPERERASVEVPKGGRTYGPPTAADLAKLTPLERRVTQNADTEPAFQNAFWDHHAVGLYVDVVTGEPLFSSQDKFESGTGWPSFTRPVDADRVISSSDVTHGMVRTEVLSAGAKSHLGHVFEDGPKPTGLRYCINSASLRFVAFADLEKEGYGAYRTRFLSSTGAPPPAATTNACAFPKPGEKAGCSATLAVALFAGPCVASARDAFEGRPEVIDTSLGVESEGGAHVVKILYDPTRTTYDAVVGRFLSGSGAEQATVLASDESEADVARKVVASRGAAVGVRVSKSFRAPRPGDAAGGMDRTSRCASPR